MADYTPSWWTIAPTYRFGSNKFSTKTYSEFTLSGVHFHVSKSNDWRFNLAESTKCQMIAPMLGQCPSTNCRDDRYWSSAKLNIFLKLVRYWNKMTWSSPSFQWLLWILQLKSKMFRQSIGIKWKSINFKENIQNRYHTVHFIYRKCRKITEFRKITENLHPWSIQK